MKYSDGSFECRIKGQLTSLQQLKEEIRRQIDELKNVDDFRVEWYNPEFKEVIECYKSLLELDRRNTLAMHLRSIVELRGSLVNLM